MHKVKGPEAIIQAAIINKLKTLDWSVRSTHGNLYQWGFPDLYAAHRRYGARWIEVKDPKRTGNVLTEAQMEFFSELHSKSIGVWILSGDDDYEIAKLFKPYNWYHYINGIR
jgi:hypothetical protein